MLERRYRRTRDSNDRMLWINQLRSTHDLYKRKQNLYREARIEDSRENPKKLWRTLSEVLGNDQNNSIPSKDLTANNFLKAFTEKIENVRQSTSSASYPCFDTNSCSSKLLEFKSVDVDFILQLITALPNKSCSLDPVPTWIIKQYSDVLAPFIAFLVNSSLQQGLFSSTQKNAIITPILKKSNLDPHIASNYRPISSLSYLSKLLERCVNEQINKYLSMNNLLPAVQSAYRKQNSTETAVLKVLAEIYSAADAGQITLLGILDLSSAFDTVDHQILFDRLQHSYGFEGAVLGWFRSYLTGRSQYIRYNGVQSESAPVLYGVPHGSVLGPVLFILYPEDVIDIATKHGFFAHSYADNLQIYDHSSQTNWLNLVPRMSAVIEEISTWLASNRL